MRLLILAEMGYGCFVSSFFFISPSNQNSSPDYSPLSNRDTTIKFGMLLPNNIARVGCLSNPVQKFVVRSC